MSFSNTLAGEEEVAWSESTARVTVDGRHESREYRVVMVRKKADENFAGTTCTISDNFDHAI